MSEEVCSTLEQL